MAAELPTVFGEIAPLNAKLPVPGAAIVPVCTGTVAPSLSSYHLTTEPLPPGPATVCWVQMPKVLIFGSIVVAACVSRVSEASILLMPPPGWVTFGGTLYDGTVMLASWNSLQGDAVGPAPVTLSI